MQEYHSFKIELAMMDLGDGKTVGVDNAIFLQDIAYWCDYNKSSGVNSFDGRNWMYSTVEELCKRHPYWTPKQMRRIINSCEKAGLLLTGNFCKNPYDRTKWYAVSDSVAEVISGKSICKNGQIEVPKWANGEDQTGKCNIKYKNKIQKEDDREEEKGSAAAKLRDEGLARVMSLYLERIEPMPSRTSIELLKAYVEDLGPDVCVRAIERAIDAGARKWTYISAILKNCEKDGIRSLADWDKRDEERKKRKEGVERNAGTEESAASKYSKYNLDCIVL